MNSKLMPVPLAKAERIRSMFAHPGFKDFTDAVRAELADVQAKLADSATKAAIVHWNTSAQNEAKDLATKAAELQIFLNVVDEKGMDGYQFHQVELTP